ncbi:MULTISPECIES: hypothetical protein [unclassified Streptomyces]|uniref:hypothetical protein n=1 Tax=unclassified Streptomyces TaxID=2593676 RepID=UPI002E77944F|nr:hypothetical protein [Streptomyces sp. JV176]MEE1804366.1 hypothetical protein [Streptomyces sp. JV176]
MSEPVSPSSSASRPRSRRGRLLRIAGSLIVLLAVACYVTVQYLSGGGGPPRCEARAGDEPGDGSATYEMTPEQAANAATIAAVGSSRGLPERAVTIALATALQESALRNLDHGDRDSLGLFQQRPSKGWGTAAQIQDPVYSAGEFYDHLIEVPGYSRLPLTEAAQRVQRSGFPQAYAKHEPDATLLSAALTGRSAASLTCSTPTGITPGDPAKVRAALTRDFGAEVKPADAAHEVSVPVPAAAGATGGERGASVAGEAGGSDGSGGTDETDGSVAGSTASQRGWELAHWAVAQSTALRIDEVAYAGRVWRAGQAHRGWQRVEGAAGGRTSGADSGPNSGAGVVRIGTAR